MRFAMRLALVVGFLVLNRIPSVSACPFCSASQPTLSELMTKADVVAFASRMTPPDLRSETQGEQRVQFQLESFVKGSDRVSDRKLELDYFSKTSSEKRYLCMGRGPDRIRWSKPLALTDHAYEYLRVLPTLPEKGPERVSFFLRYLEDQEDLLANDAYEEFARADYDSVLALKPELNRGQLRQWIADASINANRRRLYLTLLGVCGDQEDLPMLHEMIVGRNPETQLLLDALIACYLTLSGESGVELIETEFLGNAKAEYGHVYCAVLALRFHLESTEIVPKDRILQALARILDRPECVHLILPDLARTNDWSHIEKVEEVFPKVAAKGWGRVSIIQYLKSSPLPEAGEAVERLSRIDPDAARRASLFPGATITKGKLVPDTGK